MQYSICSAAYHLMPDESKNSFYFYDYLKFFVQFPFSVLRMEFYTFSAYKHKWIVYSRLLTQYVIYENDLSQN